MSNILALFLCTLVTECECNEQDLTQKGVMSRKIKKRRRTVSIPQRVRRTGSRATHDREPLRSRRVDTDGNSSSLASTDQASKEGLVGALASPVLRALRSDSGLEWRGSNKKEKTT